MEEAFVSAAKVKKIQRGNFRGEHVYRLLGETQGGRYLTVFYIYKRSQEALILSARDMDRKERMSYGRK